MQTLSKPSNRKNKHFILDQTRLKRAQDVLGTRTETETIERALDRVISEAEKDRLAWDAHEEFVTAMIDGKHQILDVFGSLEDR